MHPRILEEALTFDDVSLVPDWSDVLPGEVGLETRLARDLRLRLPLLASAMDTVTESPLAIALARLGGIGVVHKNLDPSTQAKHVGEVKAAEPGADAAMDSNGRLLVGAAVGPAEDLPVRAERLVASGVDVLVVDTAHGHSKRVLDAVALLRRSWPETPVVAGNVATGEGTTALVDAGADGVKVGIGPGSICTTRVVSGVGVPQVSALLSAVEAAAKHDVPVIADGGIRSSGDVVKALAAGAHCVMIGGLFAGTDEAPGEALEVGGRLVKAYRGMGSLGAMRAGSADRYAQSAGRRKLVPEGVEACVPCKGPLADVVFQLAGGLRSGMGYLGCSTVEELRTRPKFVRVSAFGLAESHVHDVTPTKAAPNYSK